LFRAAVGRSGTLSDRPLLAWNALHMVRRRCRGAGSERWPAAILWERPGSHHREVAQFEGNMSSRQSCVTFKRVSCARIALHESQKRAY
jgi:hypothetical protein